MWAAPLDLGGGEGGAVKAHLAWDVVLLLGPSHAARLLDIDRSRLRGGNRPVKPSRDPQGCGKAARLNVSANPRQGPLARMRGRVAAQRLDEGAPRDAVLGGD